MSHRTTILITQKYTTNLYMDFKTYPLKYKKESNRILLWE